MSLMSLKKIKKYITYFSKYSEKNIFIPAYRVIEIIQDELGKYEVKIQIINKNMIFKISPEDILAKDDIVDKFSPRDIRTLTYLGYLGINSPKYKILAKRLSESDNKLVFAIGKKGDNKIITRTIDELTKEHEILDNLNAKDAHLVGYALASESVKTEKKQKEEARKQLEPNKIKGIMRDDI